MRFYDFSQDYKKVRFGDEFKLFRGSSPRPIIDFISNNPKDPFWIKIGDMPENGYIVKNITEHISIEGSKKSRAVYKGDMILSNSMSFGKPYILDLDGFIHDGWFVIRNYEKSFDRDYLRHLLASPSVQKRYLQIASGGVVLNISSDLVNSVSVNIPCIAEQRKISNFLNLLDTRIQTQNKIIEHYESLIKTIIDSKIYNLNNERESLKTYASLKNGYAFKSENYSENGQYKIITIGNVTGDQYISDKTNNIDKIPSDIQRHQILKTNDILVSLTGNVGRVSMVNSDNCLLNQRVGLIQINNIEFRNYIYVVLNSQIFEREMINKSQGAAQLNIGKNDIENYKIPKPTKNNLEIAKLIDRYLAKLLIEKRILELYQDEKNYLLCNLFI